MFVYGARFTSKIMCEGDDIHGETTLFTDTDSHVILYRYLFTHVNNKVLGTGYSFFAKLLLQ